MSILRALVCCGLVCAGVAAAQQKQAERMFADPAELKAVPAKDGETVNLDVRFATLHTYNPRTKADDTVRLRTYNGLAVGPTIRVKPGETFYMNLKNDLPPVKQECRHHPAGWDMNTPNCFNVTNMHTHGLHVSPSDPADNVLVEVFPQDPVKHYAFKIEDNHPAGTMWYHSHRHGSTALQVSSGMEGALIVEGTRTYADHVRSGGKLPADIDTVLKQPDGRKVDDHVVLFQQVQYSCRDKDGKVVWNCETLPPDERVAGINDYGEGQFGTQSWKNSGRYTSINGVVQPQMSAEAGKIYRFRLIHGGVRDTLGLRVIPSAVSSAAVPASGVAAADEKSWTDKNCPIGAALPQFEIAADGLTRTHMSEKTFNVLQPGYRSDVLVVFPRAGVYCVTSDPLPPVSSVNGTVPSKKKPLLKAAPFDPNSRRLVAVVFVSGGTRVSGAIREYLGKQLYDGNPELPENVRGQLRALDTTAFSAMEDLRKVTPDGHQTTLFSVDEVPVGSGKFEFRVDGRPYDHNRVDKTLNLAETDEWDITANVGSHPFHIHVNPFQIVSITMPNGESILGPDGKCRDTATVDGKVVPDPQYCDQIGVFRDTIFVKSKYHVVMRTKYEDFTGDFVMHCHILDHEDEGMMQNIRIQDPKHPVTGPFGAMSGMHH